MSRRTVFCIFLSLLPFICHAQFYKQAQADSLLVELKKQESIARIQTLLSLADCYHQLQLDSSLVYALKAQEESWQLKYDLGVYKSQYQIAKVKFQTSENREVKALLKACLAWFEEKGLQKDALKCRLLMLRSMMRDTPVKEVGKYATTTLEKAEELKNPHLLGKTWLQIHDMKQRQFTGPKHLAYLDSAETYLGISGDSASLLQVEFARIQYKIWDSVASSSLKKHLKTATRWGNGALTNDCYSYLVYNFGFQHQVDSFLHYAQKNREAAKAYGSKLKLGIAYSSEALSNRKNDNPLKVIELSKKAIAHFSELGDTYEHYSALKSIGSQNQKIKEHDLAIECYIKALELARILQIETNIQYTKLSIAHNYLIIKEYQKAEQMLLEANSYANTKLSGNLQLRLMASTNESLGNLYHHQGQYSQSIFRLDSAFSIYSTIHKGKAHEVAIKKVLVCLDMNDLEKAKTTFESIQGEWEHKSYSKFFQFPAGQLKMALKEYQPAIQHLKLFLKNSNNIKFSNDRKTAYSLLYEAHNALGQYEKALEYHVIFKTLEDSIRSANVVENVALLQSKFELAEKEADLIQLEKEQEIQTLRMKDKNNEIAFNNLYILLLSITVVLIGVVSYWFYYRLRLKKEQQAVQIEAEKLALEQEHAKAKQKVELAKAKDDLFANVTHEFRTPLTLIQVPIKNYLEDAPEVDKPMFKSVLNNTEHLLQMIDEMLELAHLESGNITLQISNINLTEFGLQIKSNFSPLFRSKNIAFSYQNELEAVSIQADRNRLKMVVNNLLKNAFTHCPENGQVAMKLSQVDWKGKNAVQLSISNSGNGISGSEAAKIFDRHYRGDQVSYAGHGIGLTLSKQIAKMHAGDILVDTDLSNETIFHVVLPTPITNITAAAKPLHPKATSTKDKHLNGPVKETQTGKAKKPRVLVVEDHAEMRHLLHSTLQSDFELFFAEDGIQGEAMALEKQPDLIVSDVMMPGHDGFELTQKLKTQFATSHIPIVLLTAKASQDSKITGLETGADDYLFKPFQPKELLARAHNLIQQRKQLHLRFASGTQLEPNKLTTHKIDEDFLKKALHVINQHLTNPEFNIEFFCKELALNRTSVHLKLKALTGMSATQYIKHIRIQKAVKLIQEGQESMTAIAEMVGFNSRQAFNKSFKDQFNLTPTEFAKSNTLLPAS